MMAAALRLALISEGLATTWPVHVAAARKLFDRAGLAVDITLTGSSAKQVAGLIDGRYDIGFQQADHVVRAVEGGADLRIVMATARPPELTLVALPHIRDVSALRDAVIGVDGAASGYALLLRKALAGRGLMADDYVFLEVGGSGERHDALREGRVAASLLNAPYDRRLLAAGYTSLGTTTDFFPGYPGPVAAARRAWTGAHAHELAAFTLAMRAAYEWLRAPENREAAIALLPPHLAAERSVADAAYARFAAHPLPRLTRAGLEQVIATVWEAERYPGPPGPAARYADASLLEAS